MRRALCIPLCVLSACEASVAPAPQPMVPEPKPEAGATGEQDFVRHLEPEQATLLQDWLAAVGDRRPGESFGSLVSRAGRQQLGKPYFDPAQGVAPERIRVKLDNFQCVSFVESSLSIARCIWQANPTPECFLDEIQAYRYRGGEIQGYASRLHYFTEWMLDNAQRGRLQLISEGLGGRSMRREFNVMTRHPAKYPALRRPETFATVAAIEKRLSGEAPFVLTREQIYGAEPALEDGDVLALVGNKPGILVRHAAMVSRVGESRRLGSARLLHASRHHKRVLLTAAGVAFYLNARPTRFGFMVARPLPPRRGPVASSD